MDMKTINFDWKYGRQTLGIEVKSYRDNGNLYVGLWSRDGNGFEPFTDLTKNLGQRLAPNEAYVKTFDENEGLLPFIQENRLGAVLSARGRSGFCEYHKVAFDMDRLAEFDPEGVKAHMERHAKIQNRAAQNKSEKER
jgi:hypothetical protein